MVRLVAIGAQGCWRLGFERIVRIGPVVVALTEAQVRLLDRLVAEVGRRMGKRNAVPA